MWPYSPAPATWSRPICSATTGRSRWCAMRARRIPASSSATSAERGRLSPAVSPLRGATDVLRPEGLERFQIQVRRPFLGGAGHDDRLVAPPDGRTLGEDVEVGGFDL